MADTRKCVDFVSMTNREVFRHVQEVIARGNFDHDEHGAEESAYIHVRRRVGAPDRTMGKNETAD